MIKRLFIILVIILRVWDLSGCVDNIVLSRMSVRSLPVAEKFDRENVRKSTSEAGFNSPEEIRRSVRVRQPSKMFGSESYRAERARALFYSRKGYVGALTKLQETIQELMSAGGTSEELKSKQKAYDEVWRKFVGTHEEYVECLELLEYEEELNQAHISYQQQIGRKLTFDSKIKSWKLEALEREPYSRKSNRSRSHTSRSSGSSSLSLALAKKKEQLALAQLKTKQVLREQELKRKMSELQYAKEFMEAQMEEERAAVSFNVYEDVEGQGASSNVEEYDERLAELATDGTNMGGNQEMAEVKANMLTVEESPVEEHPCVRPTLVIQESPKILSVVKGENLAEPHNQESPQTPLASPPEHCTQAMASSAAAARPLEQSVAPSRSVGEDVARVLHQVVSMPKVEYMRFDGDPLKYVSFMHNFETCLEKDNPDNSRRLQLLIQHCFGKAKDAIESCVNLPVDEGYYVAKNALHENFGLPHIIAKAHIRKLENLRPLKQADGTSLLEFARHLEVANRTLSGMGSEYISDLNHTNTLRELNKKLPFFMRIKWTECAGRIISAGSKPQFADFLKFLKDRAKLVNNEFGEDLTTSSKEKVNVKQKDLWGRPPSRVMSLATGVRGQQGNLRRMNQARPVCVVCRGHHGVWRCDKF